MTAIETFRLDGPLPFGRLAIEASAGTGKTFTLSTLAARYVAEHGIPVSEVLMVTFTRAAAAELKGRVRSRLVDFARALNSDDDPVDPVEQLVCSQDRSRRLDRVRAAITEFDSATVTTIHGFAQQVLGTLGSTVPSDPSAVLVDDFPALIEQVATDVLVTEAVQQGHNADEVPDLRRLSTAAGHALGNPDARLVPSSDPADSDPAAALLRTMVDDVALRSTRRRQDAGTMSFDDLLVRLREAVTDQVAGRAARESLRQRFRVALIDEFQDTDPVQWGIFDTVFGRPSEAGGRPTTLVLVGDPKQAIYAFRGANIHTYLQAAHAPGTERTSLGINWRADPDVLNATEVLLTGTTFGDEHIKFTSVEPALAHRDRSVRTRSGHPVPALSLRIADGDGVVRLKNSEFVKAESGARACYEDMAVHIRNLLDTMEIPDSTIENGFRRLEPGDCAVLVGASYEGVAARDALKRFGIPAVISRGDNVLASEAASHWHRLLAAVARPTDTRRARAATLSWFIGWDATKLATVTEVELSTEQEKLHEWGEHLRRHGVAAFIGRLRSETQITERVLARTDGDRAMTDINHIAELLTLASGQRPSATALLSTFEQLSGGNDEGDPESDLSARRVESEASAVQIMTTFVAKGLEFPVVCCPTLWRGRGARADFRIWWDGSTNRRTIDVASEIDWGDEAAVESRQAAASREAVGSNLRVLYVALTRARHHTAVWWTPTKDSGVTGLARVLFARRYEDATIDSTSFTASEVEVPFGDDALDLLRTLADRADGTLEVVSVDTVHNEVPWSGREREDNGVLQVATLGRMPDRNRTRWSFTAITARSSNGHAPQVDPSDQTLGDGGAADEGARSDPGRSEDASRLEDDDARPLPLGDIKGGAGFGTMVHEILERVDFAASDLDSVVDNAVLERLAWNPWPVGRDQLVAGLIAVIDTPLGPLFDGRSLRGLEPTDRLNELEFDLTLGEGGSRCSDSDVGALILDHLESDSPMRPWAERLARGPFHTVLAGHMTGSIDLVARIRCPGGPDRYVVSDYKTNVLARTGTMPTSAMFRPDRLVAAMAENDYPLQALLYTVGLHRYLRWRLPGYNPCLNLGGVGYLFIRGMAGRSTPTLEGVPHGLFEWHPPASLITDLSDLLDGVAHVGGSPQ